MKLSRTVKIFICLVLFGLGCYGLGRLYFAATGGFTLGNITQKLSYDSRWETRTLSLEEKNEVTAALNQEYVYLSKGCQSYVFLSRDGQFVIKFFKFQRFRPQAWIDFFTFIPPINAYQQGKVLEKAHNLEKLFRSCVIGFDVLNKETGVLYVHLNVSNEEYAPLIIYDKIGVKHEIDLDHTHFILQKRMVLLEDEINRLVLEQRQEEAEGLIDKLLQMLLSEYLRGYADNDHALMQNTGVSQGQPLHIDVGQFIYNSKVRHDAVFKQEIFNKTTQLQKWLQAHQPQLLDHLRYRLFALLGIDYFTLTPYVHKGNVGKIPHEEPCEGINE